MHSNERSAQQHDDDSFAAEDAVDGRNTENEDDSDGLESGLQNVHIESNTENAATDDVHDSKNQSAEEKESDKDVHEESSAETGAPTISASDAVESFDVTSSLVHIEDNTDAMPSYNPNLFAQSTGGGRLSAKQRRQMKKLGKSAQEAKQDQDRPEIKPETPSAPVLPRGKRNKLKRMKKKYADQDELDRDRAFQLLGASSVKEFHGDDAKSPSSEDDNDDEAPPEVDQTDNEPVQGQDWIVKICFHCQNQGHVARECPQLAGFDKTAINKIVQQGQDLDREENRLYARNDVDSDFNLCSLVGCPTESDELLYALPMCAPYSAIMNYKFKLKVMPGVDKRGTAAKSCVTLCMRILRDDPDANRIQNLIKAVGDNELANVLPPALKVSAPGIGSVKTNSKHRKKPGQKRPKN